MDDKKDKDRLKEQPVTYDIYAAMPDDGNRYEIFDGSLEMMSPGIWLWKFSLPARSSGIR